MTTLNGINVLITRPLDQAERLCQLIVAHGGNPILFPTINIVSQAPTPEQLAPIQSEPPADIIIFVSANAVNPSLDWSTLIQNAKVIAIGPGTERALVAQNIAVDQVPDEYGSEGLLTLESLKNVEDKKIAIFKGEGGRRLLAETLIERKAHVIEVDTYRRERPKVHHEKIDSMIQAGAEALICTSPMSLENLVSCFETRARAWLFKQNLFVISSKMEHIAQKLGFQSIVTAKNATDDAVLEALLKMHK